MATWKGKSRGGVAGYKAFVFVINTFGLSFAYFVLRFVAFYFLFAAAKESGHSYRFFNQRLGYSKLKAAYSVYKNHYTFGKVLLDKIALLSGRGNLFTFNFDGKHHLEKMARDGKGGVLISAHIGNWEIASQLLSGLGAKVNVVMMDAEYDRIKDYLTTVTGERQYNIIPVKQDMSHIFGISNALINKEFICIHGDRFLEGAKVMGVEFMGGHAYFPAGPFSIAKRLKVPATYVYAMKESDTHYHFFATEPFTFDSSVREFIASYAQELEKKVRQYPYQWFNYYDFWQQDLPNLNIEKER
ncbi:lipid A biosynthesis acyltransferase [soil metagenome]